MSQSASLGTETLQGVFESDPDGASRSVIEESRKSRNQAWSGAIDMLLGWFAHADQLTDAEAPTRDSLQSAISLAVGRQEQGASAPASVGWSGDGGVSFEWRSLDESLDVEIAGNGAIEVTWFVKGRVAESYVGHLNPRTQQLELGAAA